jgi:hypothetical protein
VKIKEIVTGAIDPVASLEKSRSNLVYTLRMDDGGLVNMRGNSTKIYLDGIPLQP